MSTAPGTVAKAFLDALPTLDYNKMVTEARRQMGIVLVGDPAVTDAILAQLLAEGEIPGDVRLAVWRHEKDAPSPIPAGKAELVIVAPCSEAHMQQARGAFAGVALLPVRYGTDSASEGTDGAVSMPDLDARTVQNTLIGPIVERLWERRLALGRGIPGTRELIARRLVRDAASDVKVLLGSVAGAGSGRNGTPTAATAQLLLHQGALIVSLAAVYGEPLDDKRTLFARVAPNLAPTLLLDGAEAGISRLAAIAGKDTKYGKLYGPIAAYVARPALSASSTLIAGATARHVFRPARQSATLLQRSRAAGKKAAVGVIQGVSMATGLVGVRFKARHDAIEHTTAEREGNGSVDHFAAADGDSDLKGEIEPAHDA